MLNKLASMEKGGIVLGMNKVHTKLYLNTEDTHTLTIGATRSGKSRHIVLPSICTMAFAGESMVITDPKAELYLYTYPFLERLGYECVTLDFKNPLKSSQYNFLQPVIDAVNSKNIPLAVERARDVATILVPPEEKMERIWIDGQRSILTTAILAVVVDNLTRPEYQNLPNVHQFIINMTRPIGKSGTLPLTRYLDELPPEHPAKMAAGISEIAPSKMRGSFYTSAVVNLELFTDPAIHTMTSTTDFDCWSTGTKKRAIFVILPDNKPTYYSLAALFVYQHYQTLADVCDRYGGRLPVRVNFVCDEFGNFAKIPYFQTLMTVAGGRGIRFHLFLQAFEQLDDIYGDKVGRIIRSQAETWIYLQTDSDDTLKELSHKLDKYTIKSPGISGNSEGNISASYNFTGRDLLTPGEIKKISRPYQLVTSRHDPAIMYMPDFSQTLFNALLGLGDKTHNINVILQRNARRPEKPVQTAYWGIWDLYRRLLQTSTTEGEMK